MHDTRQLHLVILYHNNFSLQIQRYNSLLSDIKMSLIGLMKSINGLAIMSSDLEKIFQYINDGRVPGQWLKSNIKL